MDKAYKRYPHKIKDVVNFTGLYVGCKTVDDNGELVYLNYREDCDYDYSILKWSNGQSSKSHITVLFTIFEY